MTTEVPYRGPLAAAAAIADRLRPWPRTSSGRARSPDLAARYEQLLWRLAPSVPSAGGHGPSTSTRSAAAARVELALLDEDDRAERNAAAERLTKLPAQQQLFRAGLRVIREEDA
jgi:hypothetical protein